MFSKRTRKREELHNGPVSETEQEEPSLLSWAWWFTLASVLFVGEPDIVDSIGQFIRAAADFLKGG